MVIMFCAFVLNNRNLFFHSSGHHKSEIQVSVKLVSLTAFFLSLLISIYKLSIYILLNVHISVSKLPFISFVLTLHNCTYLWGEIWHFNTCIHCLLVKLG
jgi:hypothetical protein